MVVDMIAGRIDDGPELLLMLTTNGLHFIFAEDASPMYCPGPRLAFISIDDSQSIKVVLHSQDPQSTSESKSFVISDVILQPEEKRIYVNHFISQANFLIVYNLWGNPEKYLAENAAINAKIDYIASRKTSTSSRGCLSPLSVMIIIGIIIFVYYWR